jgi:hypothetical protein
MMQANGNGISHVWTTVSSARVGLGNKGGGVAAQRLQRGLVPDVPIQVSFDA